MTCAAFLAALALGVPYGDHLPRAYSMCPRAITAPSAISATVELVDPGEGDAFAWVGFQVGTVAWVQLGLTSKREVYFEWRFARYVHFSEPAPSGPLRLALQRVGQRWFAFVNGRLWRSVRLGVPFDAWYAGTELVSGATSRFRVTEVQVAH